MEEQKRITIHQIFWYFLIFSVAGLLIETIYCYITTGVIESRKGILWGPFCPIYGVSATILILFLHRYKNKNILQIFLYGFIIGSIAEYLISYVLEIIYGTRFWNYEYEVLNINGRICLQYSTYWGLLSVILIKLLQPLIDKIIEDIPLKVKITSESTIFVFLLIDCIFTIWGIRTYQDRVIYKKVNNEETNNIFIQVKQNIENNYFTNDRMSKTFPNLRTKDENGNEIWVKTLIKNE